MFLRKKIAPKCLGGTELHYLTRRDVFHLAGLFSELFRKAQESGAQVSGGEISLSSDVLMDLGESADEFISQLLDVSFPETNWDEVSLGDQIALLKTIWEANDIPGIVKNSTALVQSIGKSLPQGS